MGSSSTPEVQNLGGGLRGRGGNLLPLASRWRCWTVKPEISAHLFDVFISDSLICIYIFTRTTLVRESQIKCEGLTVVTRFHQSSLSRGMKIHKKNRT